MLRSSSDSAPWPLAARAQALASPGASDAEVAELLTYTENHFQPALLPATIALPLEPEPHVEVWKEYAALVERSSSIEPLRDVFMQLRFPIRAGISQSEIYRSATRRGIDPGTEADAVRLRGPV